MQPSFGQFDDSFGAELLCPSCGGNYLHHEHVEVFERGEDEEKGLHISVAHGKTTVDGSMVGNPSKRRHGVLIHFSCEACSAKPVLCISQHKGNTLVDFVGNQ